MNDFGSSKELRETAGVFRAVAETADKVADVMDQGTEEELEAAMKEYLWQLIKLQAMAK